MINLNIEQYGAMKLEHKVAIYVPGTVGVDQAADNSEQVKRVAAIFSELFGGATATTANGFWNSEAAGLVSEKVTIVYANCTTEQMHEYVPQVIELARDIRDEMKNEAISFQIDETLYIM